MSEFCVPRWEAVLCSSHRRQVSIVWKGVWGLSVTESRGAETGELGDARPGCASSGGPGLCGCFLLSGCPQVGVGTRLGAKAEWRSSAVLCILCERGPQLLVFLGRRSHISSGMLPPDTLREHAAGHKAGPHVFFREVQATCSFPSAALLIWIFCGCWPSPAWCNADCSQLMAPFDRYPLQLVHSAVEHRPARNLQHKTSQTTSDTFDQSQHFPHTRHIFFCISVVFLPFLK